MKRLALLVTLAATLAGSVAISNALATGSPTPLDFQQGFDCAVLDANGSSFITNQSTFFWFASGRATLHCIGLGAGNGTVVNWNFGNTGTECSFGFDGVPPTTTWNDRVSKSGESQLWCDGFLAPTAPSGPTGSAGVG